MALVERAYQNEMFVKIREAMQTEPAVMAQMPTGAGKTALATKIVRGVVSKRRRAGFLVHRRELIDQTSATFGDAGLPHGIIAASEPTALWQPVQICSIDTLAAKLRRGDPLPELDLLIVDEAHHCSAAGWQKVIGSYGNAYKLGLSATPQRLDGKSIFPIFKKLITGPTVSWLINAGYLSRYKCFAPTVPDLKGVRKSMGDFSAQDLEKIMGGAQLVGDVIHHYRRLANGKRAIAFCVTIAHSKAVTAQFRAAGIAASHLDGETPKAERAAAVAAFRRGDIKVLSNVDLFSEGFDIPGIEAVIMLRPTQSLGLYMQQAGRSLRTAEGKEFAVIIDHAGNVLRHGYPDDEREWSLLGAEERKRQGEARQSLNVDRCPKCHRLHRKAPSCPECGHIYEAPTTNIKTRAGELVEMTREERKRQKEKEEYERKQRRIRMAKANSLEEIEKLAREFNYKNPRFYAINLWKMKLAKRKKGGYALSGNW